MVTPIKLMNTETENELTRLIIDKLTEKECTLSNFEEISDNIRLYFENNATVLGITGHLVENYKSWWSMACTVVFAFQLGT